MSDLLVLSASNVDEISASFLPEDLQCLMAQVFVSLTRLRDRTTDPSDTNDPEGNKVPTQTPHRTTVSMENHTALFMPARFSSPGASYNNGTTSMKVVCVPKGASSTGLPATTVVLDETTGIAKAIVNARKLTALRNAAGSLLSTSLVATRYPRKIVAFGAGHQIEAHLALHIRFFSGVEQCTIINRTVNERSETLLRHLAARHPTVQFQLIGTLDGEYTRAQGQEAFSSSPPSTAQNILVEADLVICATSATEPLFPSAWVSDGTHVVLIGSYTPRMQEVETELVERALIAVSGPPRVPTLLVDSRESCLLEAGELIRAEIQPEQMTEIGKVVPQLSSGEVDLPTLSGHLKRLETMAPNPDSRGKGGPVTMFKSVGVGLQDVVIAKAVVEQAEKLQVGQTIVGYDSVQSRTTKACN